MPERSCQGLAHFCLQLAEGFGWICTPFTIDNNFAQYCQLCERSI